jgi:hypothetical protein
VPPNKRLTRA